MAPVFVKRYGGGKIDYTKAYAKAYGMIIDNKEEDPYKKITYICKNVDYSPIEMDQNLPNGYDLKEWEDAFFIPRYCYVDPSGKVLFYTKKHDITKKEDGTDSGILVKDNALLNVEGNVMVEFPKIYYKVYMDEENDKAYVWICDEKLDRDFVCYANVDADNNEIDYFYMAVFEGSSMTANGTAKIRSLYAQTVKSSGGAANAIHTTMYNKIHANEPDGSKIQWMYALHADRVVVDYLLLMLSKTTDLQKMYGSGTSGATSGNGVNNVGLSGKSFAPSPGATGTNGAIDSKGLFYSGNRKGYVSRVFGIENYFGNAAEFIIGALINTKVAGTIDGRGSKGRFFVKMTYGTYDGSSVKGFDGYGNGYGEDFIDTGVNAWQDVVSGNRVITRFHFSKYGMFPIGVVGSSGSYDKFYSDIVNYNSKNYLPKLAPGAPYPISLSTKDGQGPLMQYYCLPDGSYQAARLCCKPYAKG